MFSSLVIFVGMVLGDMTAVDFEGYVSSFREEIEGNRACTKKVGIQTVESTLAGVERAYNDFNGKTSHSVEDINFLIGLEYHMYSTINQETSLRTDSPIVAFLLRKLFQLISSDMGEQLFSLAIRVDKPECNEAVGEARTSLNREYNYRDQSYKIAQVKKKCAPPRNPFYRAIF